MNAWSSPIAADKGISSSSIEHDLPDATYSPKYLLASPIVLLYIRSQLAKRASIHFPFVGNQSSCHGRSTSSNVVCRISLIYCAFPLVHYDIPCPSPRSSACAL